MSLVFAVAACVGAVLLLAEKDVRLWGIVALIAGGAAVAIALGLLRLSLAGISISLILGGALAVAGILALMKTGKKIRVVAATVISLVGILVALDALGIG